MFFKDIVLLLAIFALSAFHYTSDIDEHALYIGVVKIDHPPTTSTATIKMRVFSDDLKSALRNAYGYESITDKETFCSDYEQYLNKYFNKYFVCTINQEKVNYQLSNCSREEEIFMLEFTMNCPTKWDSAMIKADFFMELFPNQSNIIHIEQGDTKRFGRATKGAELLRIVF